MIGIKEVGGLCLETELPCRWRPYRPAAKIAAADTVKGSRAVRYQRPILADALGTTPDEFLVGTYRKKGEEWRSTAERLRSLTPGQLSLVEHFLDWVTEQKL